MLKIFAAHDLLDYEGQKVVVGNVMRCLHTISSEILQSLKANCRHFADDMFESAYLYEMSILI